MTYLIWRLRLGVRCWRYQYAASWLHPISNFQFALQPDCWRASFDEGYSPHEALLEDVSYA